MEKTEKFKTYAVNNFSITLDEVLLELPSYGEQSKSNKNDSFKKLTRNASSQMCSYNHPEHMG